MLHLHQNNFPKVNRLLTKNDFLSLQNNSKRLNFESLVIYYKDNITLQKISKIGLSVSRKVGNSVKRNRIKRVLREIYRHSEIKQKSLSFLVVVKYNHEEKIKRDFLNFIKQINT